MPSTLILGAGVTGLAAGIASGHPVYEATPDPGGICCSYYLRPNSTQRLAEPPADGEAYRFEIGGGHWIFGGDPSVLRFIQSLTPARSYQRKSSVFLPDRQLHVPYPIQNHLRFLGSDFANKALEEMSRPSTGWRAMKEWLTSSFGPSLCSLFFDPFHDLYTAGLYDRIAPQDAYKSPVDLNLARRGASADAPAVGYNVTFIYPIDGLGTLARRMAARADIRYGKRVAGIDISNKMVKFADGSYAKYDSLLSTLPLNHMMIMAGLAVEAKPDPYTSVLVLNLGAKKGPKCPDDHWIYVPRSDSGFHRVGFYNNVDPSFLPASTRSENDRVSIYVERAYAGGNKPSDQHIADYTRSTITELQRWGYITDVEVADPTWIDVAYTWSWPESKWRTQAMRRLEEHDIFPVGRYARWIFQGIADSIRDGFFVGASFK